MMTKKQQAELAMRRARIKLKRSRECLRDDFRVDAGYAIIGALIALAEAGEMLEADDD